MADRRASAKALEAAAAQPQPQPQPQQQVAGSARAVTAVPGTATLASVGARGKLCTVLQKLRKPIGATTDVWICNSTSRDIDESIFADAPIFESAQSLELICNARSSAILPTYSDRNVNPFSVLQDEEFESHYVQDEDFPSQDPQEESQEDWPKVDVKGLSKRQRNRARSKVRKIQGKPLRNLVSSEGGMDTMFDFELLDFQLRYSILLLFSLETFA